MASASSTEISRVPALSSTPRVSSISTESQPLPPLVLIAAPESEDRVALEKQLIEWGHVVEVAGDEEALLAALNCSEPPSVLVLDTALPGLNGLALLHSLQLQSSHRRSWVIVLTDAQGAAVTGRAQPWREAGLENLLTKPDLLTRPIDEFQLRVCVHSALRMRELYAEMAESVESAHFHATHDSLTSLWNRDSLLATLSHEADRSKRLGSPLAFLLLDLDRFSAVNREHGYESGDSILRQLASRVRPCLRSYDLIGRCGEDEFLIALPGGAIEDSRSMALRLRESIAARPFDTLKGTLTLTASFGIAQSQGRSPLVVLREAESALATAKLAGGDCIRFFVHDSVTTAGIPPRRLKMVWQQPGRKGLQD